MISTPSINFEYHSGATTRLIKPGGVGWRTVPWTVCVSAVGARVKVLLEHQTYCVEDFDAFIIPANVRHSLSDIDGDNGEYISIWCHFRVNIFHGLDLLRLYDLPQKFTGKTAETMREEMVALNTAAASVNPLERAIDCQLKGYKLLETILSNSSPKSQLLNELGNFSRLAPVLNLMRQNLHRNISLKEMAAAINLSPSRFSGLFQETTGMSPIHYFNQRRIGLAQELLLSSGYTIAEISERLGFFSPYHFSHQFKIFTGFSPREYRQKIQHDLYP